MFDKKIDGWWKNETMNGATSYAIRSGDGDAVLCVYGVVLVGIFHATWLNMVWRVATKNMRIFWKKETFVKNVNYWIMDLNNENVEIKHKYFMDRMGKKKRWMKSSTNWSYLFPSRERVGGESYFTNLEKVIGWKIELLFCFLSLAQKSKENDQDQNYSSDSRERPFVFGKRGDFPDV